MKETQCLILGSGIAGLSTAIALAERGVDCVVVTAAPSILQSNTDLAQGGIIYQAPSHNSKILEEDILQAGGGVNFLPAVKQLCALGPELVKSVLLEKAGVIFDRDDHNELCLTREAAHRESRIVHSGDQSGKSIEGGLYEYCRKLKGISFLTETTAVDLLMTSFHSEDWTERHEAARCFGAFVFDQKTREVYPIFSQHTLVATGGVGQLYLHSTNSHYARGDGIAMAHRAGCRMAQMEFLQFHPTTFYHDKSRRFLITEAVRGEGGKLINSAGQSFLSKYLPEFEVPELAPRDRVAWAMNQEMIASGARCVFLDISHKPSSWVTERFPFIYASCLKYGVDITRDPIPVVPGAHYQIGGIWTGLQGETSVPHLWAAGEVSCTGLHGANRLASTSLLEGLVWGTLAGESIATKIHEEYPVKYPRIRVWESGTAPVEATFLKQDWMTLKQTMWNYVGLIKSESRLERADGILRELERGIRTFYRRAQLSDPLIGLRHATHVARLIMKACQRNTQSMGCYLREEREI